jgi:hypothetical protein
MAGRTTSLARPFHADRFIVARRRGEVVLNYSKVFICNFGEDELKKLTPALEILAVT